MPQDLRVYAPAAPVLMHSLIGAQSLKFYYIFPFDFLGKNMQFSRKVYLDFWKKLEYFPGIYRFLYKIWIHLQRVIHANARE